MCAVDEKEPFEQWNPSLFIVPPDTTLAEIHALPCTAAAPAKPPTDAEKCYIRFRGVARQCLISPASDYAILGQSHKPEARYVGLIIFAPEAQMHMGILKLPWPNLAKALAWYFAGVVHACMLGSAAVIPDPVEREYALHGTIASRAQIAKALGSPS